jgi:hypothetical protein
MSEILQLANFSTLADFCQQLPAPRCSKPALFGLHLFGAVAGIEDHLARRPFRVELEQ